MSQMGSRQRGGIEENARCPGEGWGWGGSADVEPREGPSGAELHVFSQSAEPGGQSSMKGSDARRMIIKTQMPTPQLIITNTCDIPSTFHRVFQSILSKPSEPLSPT